MGRHVAPSASELPLSESENPRVIFIKGIIVLLSNTQKVKSQNVLLIYPRSKIVQ